MADLKFVTEHHRQIERIAIVTDSELLKIMPHTASLLIHPRIKQFDLQEMDVALAWPENRALKISAPMSGKGGIAQASEGLRKGEISPLHL